jgi:hypothetical protein
MKAYFIKSSGPAKATPLQRSYVDYLLARLTEFRKAGGGGYRQRFAAPVTFAVTKRIAANHLGVDLHAPEHFNAVCAHLQSKIDDTIIGRRNAARGVASYHGLDEHEL